MCGGSYFCCREEVVWGFNLQLLWSLFLNNNLSLSCVFFIVPGFHGRRHERDYAENIF